MDTLIKVYTRSEKEIAKREMINVIGDIIRQEERDRKEWGY